MPTFPKLAYVCPIPWAEMRGDERERFCSKCARTVVNLSLLTEAQRVALLQSVPADQLCVAYYRRLSGEFVSAENPLSASESRSLVQFGATALSLGALAAAVSLVPGPSDPISNARRQIVTAYHTVKIEVEDRTKEIVEKITAPFFPKKNEPPVTMMLGAMVCPPPPATTSGSATPPLSSETTPVPGKSASSRRPPGPRGE